MICCFSLVGFQCHNGLSNLSVSALTAGRPLSCFRFSCSIYHPSQTVCSGSITHYPFQPLLWSTKSTAIHSDHSMLLDFVISVFLSVFRTSSNFIMSSDARTSSSRHCRSSSPRSLTTLISPARTLCTFECYFVLTISMSRRLSNARGKWSGRTIFQPRPADRWALHFTLITSGLSPSLISFYGRCIGL